MENLLPIQTAVKVPLRHVRGDRCESHPTRGDRERRFVILGHRAVHFKSRYYISNKFYQNKIFIFFNKNGKRDYIYLREIFYN